MEKAAQNRIKGKGPENKKGQTALYLLLSFVIPLIIVLISYKALYIIPFGNHNVAISDGQNYVYGLPGFVRLLSGEDDWLYSFRGLGGNRWSSLAWGGLHPIKLLTLFTTLETVPMWLSWISAINIALCGITMYALLAYLRGNRLQNLIFSTSYALIGFNVVNCFQILFFIGPQLLPLMALGLIKLLRGKSPLTYTAALTACIFINFYFGYHLCVASLLFFIAYLYIEHDRLSGKKKRLAITWLVSSVISGLLPAFFWLPALKAFSGGGRLDQVSLTEFLFQEKRPFIQIFTKLFSGANSMNEMIDGLPNIFCGILVVALAVLFFMNPAVDRKRKRAAGLILGFYLLTFHIIAFTLVMHGGTVTNWFPYRYSYVFSFMLILLASEEFEYLDEIAIRDTKRCGAGLLIAAVLLFSTQYEFITAGSVLLDFALLAVMWFAFCAYKKRPEKVPKRALSLLLLLLVSINLFSNYVLSIHKVQDMELDIGKYEANLINCGAIADGVRMADSGFYRMEKDNPDLGSGGVDAGFYNYYGVSSSGPAIRMFIHQGLSRLGISWWGMRHWYSAGIPAAADSLLGIKYIISERNLTEEKGYKLKVTMDGLNLFQNPYYLPVSILADKAAADIELGDDAFQNLNRIWKAMSGQEKDIFTEEQDITFSLHNATDPQTVTKQELLSGASEGQDDPGGSYIGYSFEAKRDGAVYIYDTSIPGSQYGSDVPVIWYMGNYKKGDTVSGRLNLDGMATIDTLRDYCADQVFAYADQETLKEYADLLNARDISFRMEKESHLTGDFTAEKDQRILFTIPWDEGWTCYIDGQEAPIDRTWNLFMSVEVPEGQHTWEMRFFPAWMDYGLAISGAALLGLLAFMAVWKKQRGKTEAVNIKAVDGGAEEESGL